MIKAQPPCAVIFAFTAILAGCSTPIADQKWLANNCTAVPPEASVSCSTFSNCSYANTYTCTCTYEDGSSYSGNVTRSGRHGKGTYVWPNGASYTGFWNKGSPHCGVETNGSAYVVYKQGSVHERGNADDDTAALVGAALLIGIAAAAANSGAGGGSSYTDYDWDWDYQPGNGQWVCRGITTGQYAELSNCTYDVQDDDRWPN